MGATMESLPARAQPLRSSMLKRPAVLRSGGCRLLLDPDGSVRWMESLREGRLIFGREQVWLYKIQAGVTVQSQRPDWNIRALPRSAGFSGKVFESVDVTQSFEFLGGTREGHTRSLKLTNLGSSPVKLRAIGVSDPTAAHFRDETFGWGALGVNAFGRVSHVAMDEVSDPPSARVFGTIPQPLRFYMTTDRGRASDAVQSGEVPEATAGMSGQTIILSLHELELAPQETKSILFASIYHPKLEDALAEFASLQKETKGQPQPGRAFGCSNPQVVRTFEWALASVAEAEFDGDALDRLDSMPGLLYTDPAASMRLVARVKASARKDGSLGHSLDPGNAGLLETALLLNSTAHYLLLSGDKKPARTQYPFLRKSANFLLEESAGAAVHPDPKLPQGWRRLLGKGYPTGEIPEVSVAVATALATASQLARVLGKGADASRFRERGDMIIDGVRKRLTDERGLVALAVDSTGKLHGEDTIDTAVACYRGPGLVAESQAAAHRLLEKDFESGYGPRTVPTSNRIFFNGTYGQGQLGGYWTRAALAHAILCYRSGLAGTGSLILEKIARLVAEDSVRLGGGPGEFPLWMDVEGRASHGGGSDPVSASRFIEALVEGELGFSFAPGGLSFSPATTSTLKWLGGEFWIGTPATVFVGRLPAKVALFVSGLQTPQRNGSTFSKAEQATCSQKGLTAFSFFGPGQVICVGNGTGGRVQSAVSFSPRGEDMSKRLSVPLEEYDPAKETWGKVGSLRVQASMSFDATLGPSEWKAFRVSA
ncbi:MAG: hypothetical protein HY296_02975 [Thaumarchaeota archaeon]|nr:hypothetical protein [Nitrososphaerota archaeon]